MFWRKDDAAAADDYGGDGGDDGDVDDYDVDDDDNVGMSGILCWATILLERLYFPCFFNQLPSMQFWSDLLWNTISYIDVTFSSMTF